VATDGNDARSRNADRPYPNARSSPIKSVYSYRAKVRRYVARLEMFLIPAPTVLRKTVPLSGSG
jgi:hypothetical protein